MSQRAPCARRTDVHVTIRANRKLGDSPFVMLEQSAKPLATADVAQRQRFVIGRLSALLLSHRGDEEFVADVGSLVRPLGVIMLEPRLRDAVEVLHSEEDELVQVFAPQRTDESLDERLRIGRLGGTRNDCDSRSLQRGIEIRLKHCDYRFFERTSVRGSEEPEIDACSPGLKLIGHFLYTSLK